MTLLQFRIGQRYRVEWPGSRWHQTHVRVYRVTDVYVHARVLRSTKSNIEEGGAFHPYELRPVSCSQRESPSV